MILRFVYQIGSQIWFQKIEIQIKYIQNFRHMWLSAKKARYFLNTCFRITSTAQQKGELQTKNNLPIEAYEWERVANECQEGEHIEDYATIETNSLLWTQDKKIVNFLDKKYIYN
jgi:hypothetical protein